MATLSKKFLFALFGSANLQLFDQFGIVFVRYNCMGVLVFGENSIALLFVVSFFSALLNIRQKL